MDAFLLLGCSNFSYTVLIESNGCLEGFGGREEISEYTYSEPDKAIECSFILYGTFVARYAVKPQCPSVLSFVVCFFITAVLTSFNMIVLCFLFFLGKTWFLGFCASVQRYGFLAAGA